MQQTKKEVFLNGEQIKIGTDISKLTKDEQFFLVKNGFVDTEAPPVKAVKKAPVKKEVKNDNGSGSPKSDKSEDK